MNFFRLLGFVIAFSLIIPAALLSSCEDSTSTIGESIVTDESKIIIDSTFTVIGRSVVNDVLEASTITQLLGTIDANGYGHLSSDYVTQMMPSSSIDTVGVTIADIDSICLVLRFYGNKITGDSLVPMGVKAYELTRQLPEVLNSGFSPEGYYNPSKSLGQTVYTSNNAYSDTTDTDGTHVVVMKLPIELGRNFFELYKNNSEVFQSPIAFAKAFPGLFISNSFGSGRVTNIFNTRLALYYHSNQKYTNTAGEERDTVYYRAGVLAASTPEVVSNNNLSFSIAPQLKSRVDQGEALIVAPLGYNVQFRMPMHEIVSAYRQQTASSMGVINSLSIFIPAETIENENDILPPSQILLIRSDKTKEFFNNNQTPDNKTSFLATYSDTQGGYTISNLRAYIKTFIDDADGVITDTDCLFDLIPVNTETETVQSTYSSYTVVTSVGPHIDGPAMVKICLDKAKIKFTYSTQTVKI